MIHQENPITDMERRSPEQQSVSTITTGDQGGKASQPVTPSPPEQPRVWFTPPFFVPAQRPYMGPGYCYYPFPLPVRRKSSP
jgi:hypothetical protein